MRCRSTGCTRRLNLPLIKSAINLPVLLDELKAAYHVQKYRTQYPSGIPVYSS